MRGKTFEFKAVDFAERAEVSQTIRSLSVSPLQAVSKICFIRKNEKWEKYISITNNMDNNI